MSIELLICLPIVVCSLTLNAYLYLKIKENKKKPQLTDDANYLLATLLKRKACVIVEMVDPGQMFLFGSKGRDS